IRLTAPPEERFSHQEFTPLKEFFQEKIVQVHIMGRYAHLGLETIKKSLFMVREYFQKQREAFLQSYFQGEEKLLEIPATPESHQAIVTALDNPVQEQAVTSNQNRNLLILAGPGSGKTRTIVHRIGYLVRIKRVPPARILALAFNRSAVTELKTRLKELIGRDAAPVRVHTYHSLAMSLTGRSLAGRQSGSEVSGLFQDILEEAVRLLADESGADREFSHWRDRLLAGVRYILVDEYQDINELEYRFLSLLAGRNEEQTGHKPQLMAVGDDDQNIYAWDGANVRFIRRFAADYQSRINYLTDNYRSRPGIIHPANSLISKNRDRMKTEYPIVPVRPEDSSAPALRLIRCPDRASMFKAALNTAQDILAEHPGLSPGDICLLCRTNRDIAPLQVLARQMGLKTSGVRTRGFSLTGTREFRMLLDLLEHCKEQSLRGEDLQHLIEAFLEDSGWRGDNPWLLLFAQTLKHYLAETGSYRMPVRHFIGFVYDFSREARQGWLVQQDYLPVSTMHGVKGLEFPVVIIIGQPALQASLEEERRLFYVAMTRAKDRLICLDRADGQNPFIEELNQEAQIDIRFEQPELSAEEARACRTELWELGLSDLVISFPAYPAVIDQAQAALTEMEPGDSRDLAVLEQGENLFITCMAKPIARFSVKGKQTYQQKKARGFRVERVVFLAAILRQRQESNGENSQEATASWYTGLFQILLNSQERR
ncbi:MAG: ATP-dependent helicase, partial [Thermodesulfobacteriota bacterium]